MLDRIDVDRAGYEEQNPNLSVGRAYDMAKLNEVNRARVEALISGASTKTVEAIVGIAKRIKSRIDNET